MINFGGAGAGWCWGGAGVVWMGCLEWVGLLLGEVMNATGGGALGAWEGAGGIERTQQEGAGSRRCCQHALWLLRTRTTPYFLRFSPLRCAVLHTPYFPRSTALRCATLRCRTTCCTRH